MCEVEYDPQRKYEKRKDLIEGIAVVVLLIIAFVAVSFIIPIPISIVKEQGVTYIRPIFTDYYEAYDCDESWLDITISREIKGKLVKVITAEAFSDCKCIQKITLPDSIEIIEEQAFIDCVSLDSLIIPKSVKKIYGQIDSLVSDNICGLDGGVLRKRTSIEYEGNKEDFKQIVEPEELSIIRDSEHQYNVLEYRGGSNTFYIFCVGEKYEKN